MLKKIIVAAAMGTMLLIAGCGKEKTAVSPSNYDDC